MRRWAWLFGAALGCHPAAPVRCELEAGLPAFPGAEGFGTTTPGGRGGAVLAVTTLADHGPGSLRAALEADGPRTVIFRVSGTIALESQLQVWNPYVTVAGQTAPGGGIALKNAGLVVFTHNVLVQHLRIRPGPSSAVAGDANDTLAVVGPAGGEDIGPVHHIVFDHVSTSWSEDELVEIGSEARDITLSWSILAEALDEAGHEKGHHSAGLLVWNQATCVSAHHVLLAHDDFRNPLLSSSGTVQFANSVAYDWGSLAGEVSQDLYPMEADFLANQWIPGPSTLDPAWELLIEPQDPVQWIVHGYRLLGDNGSTEVFVEGNLGPHRPVDAGPEASVVTETATWPEPATGAFLSANAHTEPLPSLTDATTATAAVLAGAGATAPARDAVDARIVAEVLAGTGKIIDDPSEVGGWPDLGGGEAAPDGDGDGLPDAWELARGLDPASPADGPADPDGDGYTNLEDWLFSLLPS